MRRFYLFIIVSYVFVEFSLWAQPLNYVACPPRSLGCYTGRYSLGAGLGWSRFREQTSFWPNLKAEVGLLKHLAVELSFGGVNSEKLYQSLSAAPSMIFGVGIEVYPNELYRGMTWRVGASKHLYRQDINQQRYSIETALLSTVGWRWRPKSYAGSFVLGLGAQKVLEGAKSIQPLVETQIAVDFNLEDIFF